MQRIIQTDESVFRPTLGYYLQDSTLLRRHEEGKPPMEAYLFFPSSLQRVEYDDKNRKKTLRRVFEMKSEVFLPYEDGKLRELGEEIKRHNEKNSRDMLVFPKDYKDYEKRRFLQATGFNIAKTIQLIKENIRWRVELIPPTVTLKVVELINCGFMYMHGRDNNYRPILVLNADCYMKLKDNYQYGDWVQAVIFFMEYLIEHMVIPGQVENWNIITDLNGVSLLFLPSELKKIMNILQSNYRCRLYVNFIIGMGIVLRGVWKIIKGMLDETTVRKVRILDDSDRSQIFEFINEEQVEKKYGGKADNVIPGMHNCFPPAMPSRSYLTKDVNKETHLINERQYKEMQTENKLTVCPQFYINKWREEDAAAKIMIRQREDEERLMKDNPNLQPNLDLFNNKLSPITNLKNENLIIDMIDINSASGLSSQLDSVSIHNLKMTKIQMKLDSSKDGVNVIEDEFSISNRSKFNEFKKKITNRVSKKSGHLQIGKHICNRTPDILPYRENSFFFDRKVTKLTKADLEFKSKEFSTNLNYQPLSKIKKDKSKGINSVNESYIFPELQTNNQNSHNYNADIKTYQREGILVDKSEVKAFCTSDGCIIF